MAPKELDSLVSCIQKEWEANMLKNENVAVLVDSTIRSPLRQSIYRSLKDVSVIAYSEVPDNLVIDAKRIVRLDEVITNPGTTNLNDPISDMLPDSPANQQD
jgi:flagellar biosynthesis protein FlhA